MKSFLTLCVLGYDRDAKDILPYVLLNKDFLLPSVLVDENDQDINKKVQEQLEKITGIKFINNGYGWINFSLYSCLKIENNLHIVYQTTIPLISDIDNSLLWHKIKDIAMGGPYPFQTQKILSNGVIK